MKNLADKIYEDVTRLNFIILLTLLLRYNNYYDCLLTILGQDRFDLYDIKILLFYRKIVYFFCDVGASETFLISEPF